MNFEVHFMSLGFCVKCAQCLSRITACFITSITTCRKSLYCVSSIADKKQSSLQNITLYGICLSK